MALMVWVSFQTCLVHAATLTLNVVSARAEPKALGGAGVAKGAAVSAYKYLLNVDNTGTTEQRSPNPGSGCSPQDAGYPLTCNWVSIAGAKGASPVLTQGEKLSGGPTVSLPICDAALTTGCVPQGRYLISVLADGFKLDGQHFSISGSSVVVDGSVVPGNVVTVPLQPTPLPDAQIQAAVFEDVSPVNSAPDLPAEHGLAGFQGHILDVLGEVTTNVYGHPLCSKYDAAGALIPGSGGRCLSACYVVSGGVDVGTVAALDAAGRCPVDPTLANGAARPMLEGGVAPAGAAIEGKVKIPNLGPNRYTLSVTPPDGSGWVQTTTLEGNHDWDAWVMEGATGLDTEFIIAGEPFPAIIFGYTPAPGTPSAVGSALPASLSGSATIKGVVEAVKIYVPTTGGVGGLPGEIWGGLQGAVIDKPIANPWVTLTNLGNGDTIVWAGQGGVDGRFTIPNVPAGTYTLTWWDEPQNQILDLVNVTVADGETVDMGILPLSGWWTVFDGYVFDDANRNGIKDPGEQGLAGYTLTMRRRDNSLMDRGSTAVTTDANGYYRFEAAYPMTQWLVMEAYDNLHYGTGVTYQADNQPTPTTVMGAGVDVSVHPIIGLSGRLDWGKHTYDSSGSNGIDPQNGGIVGTVSYDTTRNELDPRYAAVEDWQPSIPDLVVKLFEPLRAAPGCIRLNVAGSNAATATCDASGLYALDASTKAIAKGQLLNTYLSETWFRPSGCIVRGADGTPVSAADQNFLPLDQAGAECIEAPMTGVQFSPDAANVNGNYGFGDGCFAPNLLDARNPAEPVCRNAGGVDVGFTALPGAKDYLVQVDLTSQLDLQGKPIYKVTREEDINIGNGDAFLPAVPPSACAGALHVVDSSGNATFPGGPGTSPYEGQKKPLCDMKLVRLSNGSSIAPSFNIFTDVPLPGRHWFIVIDDLNFSSNPQSITFGEKAGMPFVPVGIYDYSDRLVTTVESDYNGLADVLLPSTNRINCPTPSGVCANLYRYVGNDPGIPGRLNPNFNPSFRTIAAEFEVLPGQIIPADLAPTQVGVSVQLPGSQTTAPVMCMLDETSPQLYAVNDPVIHGSGALTLAGLGFGTTGQVTLNGVSLAITAWTDTAITASVPAGTAPGPQQLLVTRSDNGRSTVNGLTIHVLGAAAGPALPSISTLDNFNRANANTLGANWSQNTFVGAPAIRLNASQANAPILPGLAIYNTPTSIFGASQAAALTFATAPVNAALGDAGVILKASGGNTNNPSNAIRVVADASGQVRVRTTVAGSTSTVASIPASFAAGNRLTAAVTDTGLVHAWKTAGASTSYLGSVQLPSTGANAFVKGTGRIGIVLPSTARADDFAGGSVPLAGGGASGYNPMLYAVGPSSGWSCPGGATCFTAQERLPAAADHAIQNALNAAAAFVDASSTNAARGALVVVYPNAPTVNNPRQNPRGAYYENLIINANVKLQGVGPGSPTGSVRGSIIDGSAFAGDSPVATDWYTQIGSLTRIDAAGNAVPTWAGNSTVYDGAVISLYLPSSGNRAFPAGYDAKTAPAIDGFDLRGGDQQGFPGNINAIGGTRTGLPGGLITQGGAIFANAYARNLQITNNVVQNNGGAYGTIRIGTPDLPAPDTSNHNEKLVIAHNRVIQNAGTNQAGGIGLFAGADDYQVTFNDICGNFSSEYGGGVSAVGYSPRGSIANNRIYFNRAFDEGGGIMIAGTLPATTTSLSPGSGPVTISGNLIQGNLSNDDGGGLRFLMAGNFPMNVYNNFIVNNISTHEGGGIALNDTPDVRVFNNTIMKNLTTATALTSSGAPAPAGLSTSRNSDLLQATLPLGSPQFSNPLLFNNVFWDNRAGTRAVTTVTGLSTADADVWDLGDADGVGVLAPTNSVIQQSAGAHPYTSSVTNVVADPQVVTPYDIGVTFNSWRNNPGFLGAIMISADLPPYLLGDYHLQSTSPAIDRGAASQSGIAAPTTDIDRATRPFAGGYDIGADEDGADSLPPASTTPTPPPVPPVGSAAISNVSLGTLSGSLLNFASVNGTVQSTLTYSVSGGTAVFGNVRVQGGNGERFSEGPGGTCQRATVAAGASCTVVVRFQGNGNQLRTGTLTVTVNGTPTTLTLTGQ